MCVEICQIRHFHSQSPLPSCHVRQLKSVVDVVVASWTYNVKTFLMTKFPHIYIASGKCNYHRTMELVRKFSRQREKIGPLESGVRLFGELELHTTHIKHFQKLTKRRFDEIKHHFRHSSFEMCHKMFLWANHFRDFSRGFSHEENEHSCRMRWSSCMLCGYQHEQQAAVEVNCGFLNGKKCVLRIWRRRRERALRNVWQIDHDSWHIIIQQQSESQKYAK